MNPKVVLTSMASQHMKTINSHSTARIKPESKKVKLQFLTSEVCFTDKALANKPHRYINERMEKELAKYRVVLESKFAKSQLKGYEF